MATASDYTEVTQQLYLAYFGRPADPIGLANMTANLLAGGAPTHIADFKQAYAAGGVVKTLLDSFANSPESSALYTGDDTQFIISIYNNVLDRAPLLNGLAFWTGALRNHDMTRAEAAVQIMAAAVKPGANAADAATVAGRMAMANLFTNELVTQQDVAYYVGPQAAQQVRDLIRVYAGTGDASTLRAVIDDFLASRHNPIPMGVLVVLAHGPDHVAGGPGNDTINAPSDAQGGDSLEAGDSIDGAGGRDTMLLSTQGVVTRGATVRNVETVNLSSEHAITAADLSGWTGLDTLNITAAGAVSGVLAASTTDISLAAGQGAVTLSGGHHVLARTAHGDITIGAGQAASGDVVVSNSAAGGAINVNAAGFATLVAQDGAINITGTTSFIASAYTAVALAERHAHLAAQASASAAVATAQASGDTTALAAATAALSAANATVLADADAAASAAHVVVTATSNTALTSATVNGNYGSSGNAITDGSAQHNTLTSVTLNNAGAVTLTGQAITSVSATGMNDDVTIVNSKAGHVTALTLNGVAGGNYTDDGAATVRLVADGGTANVLDSLHAAAAHTVIITGSGGVELRAFAGATALGTINASVTGDLKLTTGALALSGTTEINAYPCSGAVTIDASGATGSYLHIVGAANGVNHLTGSATQGNYLVGGNGANTLRGGAAADSFLAFDGDNTIIGGGGSDNAKVGNGRNTIDMRGTDSASVIVGNGDNVILGGGGSDHIFTGTGSNLVTGGGGGDVVRFGLHGTGVVDGLVYASLSGDNDTGGAITASGYLGAVDFITGLHGGDHIQLGQASGALSNDLGGAFTHAVAEGTASAEMVRGDYVASTSQFIAAANGADTLLAWADADASHGTAAIVLLGYADATASAMNAAGLIVLG
ncbi:DUF4214 domain-containing protein [Rugamonas apoptosis]|uniref:DUF4214 domain-containing protein n=1 Tax=Rugamonas apoptosis TaxID=2758570 RepID=A0A7W2F9F6_9BURK|nr:DUF4214 domain-containing protein [Rugamonas apoptosis]MBA5687563.1 DUF4214 domain-containing protein [Rugamonas apoptosis]